MKKTLSSTFLILILLTSFLGCSKNTLRKLEPSNVKYITVTRAYDWGPAIDKVILCFETQIDPTSFDINTFSVDSIRTYADYNKITSKMNDDAKDHVAQRTITNVYVSDREASPVEAGNCITIQMEVGPTLAEASPYNYNVTNGYNEVVETSYEISLNSGKFIKSTEGEKLVFSPTGAAENEGDIKIIADDFVNNQIFSFENANMTYAYYEPQNNSKDKGTVPLIVWLHGYGEGGTDTTVVLLANEVVNLATEPYQKYFGSNGAYVLVPQVPTSWMDIDGTGKNNYSVYNSHGESYYTEALMSLIDTFVEEHPDIDTNRICIGGCSNGGYMTVNMLINYPDYFAAAFPICAAYWRPWMYKERIESIKDIPIWLTCSLTDGTIPIAKGIIDTKTSTYILEYENGNPILIDDFSNAVYTRLIRAGAKNVYYSRFDKVIDTSGLYKNSDGTPYEYWGHFSWIYALNNECIEEINGKEISLFEWLGQQSK